MIRVVLDTNVLVSALIKTQGNEAILLDLVSRPGIQLCVSEPILVEYADVLSRSRLRLDPLRVQHLRTLVRCDGTLVTPTQCVRYSTDEPDNRFLECAEASQADYLVTGNAKHFPARHGTTTILNARRFLEILR